MPKLVERVVNSIEPDPTKEQFVWDNELKGFGLRVSPKGRKTFFLQYRVDGRTRRIKLGVHPKLKAEKARSIAMIRFGKIEEGSDPSKERHERRKAPTMANLAADYLERHAPKKRESSVRNDRQMLTRFIIPRLGNKLVKDVTLRDVEGLHLSLERTPYQANRVLALLSKMLSMAVSWNWCASNPSRGIKRFAENPRERWLVDEELIRLSDALNIQPNQLAANAVRLLLLTGARRNEVLSATWDQFDMTGGVWTKPSHHTKQNKLHRVPLNPATLSLLDQIRSSHADDIFLFPGRVNGTHLQDIKKFWRSTIVAADLLQVRLHDLRHTYASHLVSGGVPLAIVGHLLGHTQISTTQRYTHLADDQVRQANDRFGAKLVAIASSRQDSTNDHRPEANKSAAVQPK